MIDADGSADPAEIPRFVAALLDGADFAKGTRFAEGGGSGDITRLRSLGNYALTAFFNACYGRNYSDLCYGFNVFWRRHLPVLGLDATSPADPEGDGRLWGDGFEVETLIHVRVAKAGLVVAEVPSFEHARLHGVSNLNAFRDGRRVLQTILAERRPYPAAARQRPYPANPFACRLSRWPKVARNGSSTAPDESNSHRLEELVIGGVSGDMDAAFGLYNSVDAGEISVSDTENRHRSQATPVWT